MPSPFPGMDPYLEPHWQAVHSVLVTYGWQRLNRVLPEGLVACVEERLAIEAGETGEAGDVGEGRVVGRVGPDVRVLAPGREPADAAAVVIDAPYELEVPAPRVADRHVSIVDGDGRLVTVVEFLSPSNKRRPGVVRFRRNRDFLLDSGVHCVEVDLVRAGSWRAVMRPEACPPAAVSTYRAVVRTAGDEGRSGLFPIGLRDPLPDVPVPLRPGDPSVRLPLQQLMASIYDDGRWHTRIDYRRPLRLPLDPGDAAWAAALLAARPA